jgi:hypothetical protein
MNATHISKIRRISGNVLIAIGGLILLASAGGKFSGAAKVVEGLNAFGYEGKITALAVIELGCSVLYLIPMTRSLGLLLVSSYLGGAIATHWSHGHNTIPPAVILAVLWTGALLRHPEMAWSFRRSENNL